MAMPGTAAVRGSAAAEAERDGSAEREQKNALNSLFHGKAFLGWRFYVLADWAFWLPCTVHRTVGGG